jgi:hypothetical protein
MDQSANESHPAEPTPPPEGAPAPEAAPAPTPEEPVDGRITLYRVLVGVLMVVILGAWVFFDHVHNVLMRRIAGLEHQLAEARGGAPAEGRAGGPEARPGAELETPDIDVADRLARMAKAQPDRAEMSESYLGSKQGTVVLRVMGHEQTWPLHLHRRGDELSVLVGGHVDVKHVYGKDGKLVTASIKRGPGTLFFTPANTGVEWVNGSKTDLAGALVITAPPSDGNFYVRPDDERLAKGGEPFAYDPADDLAKLAAGADASQTKKLPFFGERASLLLVKTEAKVPRDPQRVRTLFVLAGSGTVDGGKPQPIAPSHLLVLRGATPVTVKATGGPLAALVFDAEVADAKDDAKPAAPAASAAAKP